MNKHANNGNPNSYMIRVPTGIINLLLGTVIQGAQTY